MFRVLSNICPNCEILATDRGGERWPRRDTAVVAPDCEPWRAIAAVRHSPSERGTHPTLLHRTIPVHHSTATTTPSPPHRAGLGLLRYPDATEQHRPTAVVA
jgi:hypothetical protein